MRLGWSFLGLLVVVGCASASTYLPETEPAVPGLAPRHDDPKSCVQGPEDEPPASPNQAWHRREVSPRAAKVRECTHGLANPGRIALSLHGAPNEKPDVRVVEATGYDCSVVACIKRSFADLPSPPSAHSFTLQFASRPDAVPTSAPGALTTPPSEPSCLDAPRTDESKKHATNQDGALPPETIQAVIRASYGHFRRCYEDGLGRDPNLAGSVMTRFVIGLDGRVSAVRTSGNTLPDCQVVACVRARFARLVFPKPKDKPVTVVYPIMLEAGDAPKPAPHGP